MSREWTSVASHVRRGLAAAWRRIWHTDRGTYRRRLVLTTGVASTAVALALVGVVDLAVGGSASDAADQVLVERAAALIAAVRDASSGSVLVVPPAQQEAGTAVYDGAGKLVAGEVPSPLGRRYAELSGTSALRKEGLGDAYRILAQRFTSPSGSQAVVVVSERLAPYQSGEDLAVAIAVSAGLLVIGSTTLLAAWAAKRALTPVLHMARTARAWSAQDLGRRFDLGPPSDEIRALGTPWTASSTVWLAPSSRSSA